MINKYAIADELAAQMKSNMRPVSATIEEKVAAVLDHLNQAAEAFDEAGNAKFATLVTNVVIKLANEFSSPEERAEMVEVGDWARRQTMPEEMTPVKKLDVCAIKGHDFDFIEPGESVVKCHKCGNRFHADPRLV